MKIAIIGSLGVGKTFLCNELFNYFSQKGLKVEVMDEVARSCPLPLHENSTEDAQLWILMTQIKREIEAQHKSPDLLICDRGVIDNYAYYLRKANNKTHLHSLVDEWTKTYDYIIKLPNTSQYLIDDGFRSTNESFQKEMEQRITNLLKERNIKFVELKQEEVKAFIEKKLNGK